VKARLLRTLIAERVSSDEKGPGAGWTDGSCRRCDEKVWLSNAWAELLAVDPQAVVTCLECAHELVEDPT
jgi:hypothetical protein